ncbi:MAG: VIT1/CCC1 family predicted Fe2+/Mn2+ transporter [Kiritimatiellia bacterium]|jgi:VIT1/CCC1 family predicted Fe2+/Mn2+ transporter
MPRIEHHRSTGGGRLRAAVLGGNDGIVSTSALVIGIAAATPDATSILLGGIAGLVAGALSMGVGEYISVSSERDAQRVDVALEEEALANEFSAELLELTELYVERGLEYELAEQVATQLMEHDALGTHLREELGLDPDALASPVVAALASSLSFTLGALPPVLVAATVTADLIVPAILGTTVVLLGLLGVLSARQSGASKVRSVGRVVAGGMLAMGLSAGIGKLVGAVL